MENYQDLILLIKTINDGIALFIKQYGISISTGIVTNFLYACLVVIVVIIIRKAWMFINRLMPLTITEIELLKGINIPHIPQSIRILDTGIMTAGTCKIDSTNKDKYLKAIKRLKRKRALEAQAKEAGMLAIYDITPYGKKRLSKTLHRYQKFNKILNNLN